MLRKYKTNDFEKVYEIFILAVSETCKNDYSPAEIHAWLNGKSKEEFAKSLLQNTAYVYEIDDVIAGFGDVDCTGYVDRLFVSPKYQNQNVGTTILTKLEENFSRLTVHASITAKDFFIKRGYVVVKENVVIRESVRLTNYLMQKTKT